MSKFFEFFLLSWRRSFKILRTKFIRNILSVFPTLSKQNPQCQNWNNIKPYQDVRLFVIILPLAFNEERKAYSSTYEIEKKITDLVILSEEMLIKGDFTGAKNVLLDALKIAENTNVYGNISSVYDLLVSISLQEGGISEAEDMLANFIDKLLQLGYPEDHNHVVRFKLKLARLYQTVGNRAMAELGYRDCIAVQERKLQKMEKPDENTLLIFVNSLFWYGKLLAENGDFRKAKAYMQMTLKKMQECSLVAISQVMVVLYHNAEIATVLKEYDRALSYLYKAIDLSNGRDVPDLPLYVVKIGEIFLLKGVLENAEFWCSSANRIARNANHQEAERESSACLKQVAELRKQKRAQKTNHTIKV